jgi:2-polyprenyl-6-methoxyphenol hydroxylase-like FAD-dependent oxidoreductase
VIGITVRETGGSTGVRQLGANLVVDASGRGSRTPAWLHELGFQTPDVSEVKIGVGYTSRLYRRRPDDLTGAKLVMSSPTPPDERRFGVLFPIEDDRWLLTLGGWLGDHPPTDNGGFQAFARSLPAVDLGRIAALAEPLGDFALHKVPSSLRRYYERLDRVPDGLLAIGDAVCSFNPIYGQGMTVAALEAEELESCLREGAPGRSWTGLPRRFYARIASVVDASWTMAVSEDFRFPEVTGPKPPGTDLTNWYMGYVHRATLRDPVVCREFLRVMSMLKPPSSLFHPGIVARALWEGAAGPSRPQPDGPSREAA